MSKKDLLDAKYYNSKTVFMIPVTVGIKLSIVNNKKKISINDLRGLEY